MSSTAETSAHQPLDNYQRFERRVADIEYLQTLGDQDNPDLEAVNQLTETINDPELQGVSVSLGGGLVESVAIDADGTSIKVFRELDGDERISGIYRGLCWRQGYDSRFDNVIYGQMLCHAVETANDTFEDESGARHHITRFSFITAVGSDVRFPGFIGSHSYEELKFDGFTSDIDAMLTEELPLEEQWERVVAMFGVIIENGHSKGNIRLNQQRISYLNEIGLFRNRLCMSPLVYKRTPNMTETELDILWSEEGIPGVVHAIGVDYPCELTETGEAEYDSSRHVISLEVEVPGKGTCTIPYIKGKVKFIC